jgi:hypothetical protein
LLHDSPANRRLEDAADRAQSGRDLMLPVTLQFLVALIAYAISERMARKVDYVPEEVLVLKDVLATAPSSGAAWRSKAST